MEEEVNNAPRQSKQDCGETSHKQIARVRFTRFKSRVDRKDDHNGVDVHAQAEHQVGEAVQIVVYVMPEALPHVQEIRATYERVGKQISEADGHYAIEPEAPY